MSKTVRPRIAILGAGPIGLEALLYARTLGYPVTVYEAGQLAHHVRQWGHVRLFSPFGMNSTRLGRNAIRQINPRYDFPADHECITGLEHLSRYIEPMVKYADLYGSLQTDTRVLHIGKRQFCKGDAIGDVARGKQSFRLLLQDKKKQESIAEADIILDCTGTYSQPRWLGQGGIPAVGELAARSQICYTLEDVLGKRQKHYTGKMILVVGAGYSAATTVCQLAELAEKHQDTWIIWAARGKGGPIPRIANDVLKERDRLASRANSLATRSDGNVEFHPRTVIEEVSGSEETGFVVTARSGDEVQHWEVERIIANVGFSPNAEMYRELQIHECYATLGPIKLAAALLGQESKDCLQQTSPGPDTLRNPEPGYFILGAKSYGRNSQFLLRIGFEQIRDVFRLISGNGELDLYQT